MNKLLQFIKESRAELRKVNWPTRQQTIKFTGAVIGVSVCGGDISWWIIHLNLSFVIR